MVVLRVTVANIAKRFVLKYRRIDIMSKLYNVVFFLGRMLGFFMGYWLKSCAIVMYGLFIAILGFFTVPRTLQRELLLDLHEVFRRYARNAKLFGKLTQEDE